MSKTVHLIVTSCLLSLLGAGTVFGQSGHRRSYAHQRDHYSCGKPEQDEPMDDEPEDDEPPVNPRDVQSPSGVFAAPPRTGAVAGGTRSYGINGMKIKFPSLEIGLPGIELPSFTCLRRAPEMQLAKARAPFIPFSHAMPAGPQVGGAADPRNQPRYDRPQQDEPPCEQDPRGVGPPPPIPDCPTDGATLLRMLDEIRVREEAMAAQMQALDERIARLQRWEAAGQRRAGGPGTANAANAANAAEYPAHQAPVDNRQVRWAEQYPVRPSAYVAPEPLPVPRRLPADLTPRRMPQARITGVSALPN